MKGKIFVAIAFVCALALASIVKVDQAHAATDTTSFGSHKSACISGANAIDPTGTAALVCTGYGDDKYANNCYYDNKNKVSHNGYTYGAIFLEPASGTTETDGLNPLSVKAYGATYNCNTYNQNTGAEEISFSDGITADSTTLDRPSPNPKTWAWGARSSSYLNVTIPISALSGASSDSSGKHTKQATVWSKLQGNRGGTAHKPIYIEFYKITRLIHGTPTATYSGSGSGTQTDPYVVNDNADRIYYTHKLARNDGWSGNISIGAAYYLNSGSWTDKQLPASTASSPSYEDIKDEILISSLSLEPNVPKEVCSSMTHKQKSGLYGYTISNPGTDVSKKCVWIKDARVNLTTSSKSTVDNSVSNNNNDPATPDTSTKTVESWGGSRGNAKSYTYSFTHQLQLKTEPNYSYALEYYIIHTENGSAKSITGTGPNGSSVGNGSASSPNRATINSGGASTYTPVFTYSAAFPSAISAGESTPTICETIYFRPKKVEVKVDTGVYTPKDNSWQSSTVCTKVQRRSPKTATISATCSKPSINGDNSGNVVYSTNPSFGFQFGFNLATSNTSQKLDTTYTIKRTINGGTATTVKGPTTTKAPTSGPITDSPTITFAESEYGTSKKVCETLYANPYLYTIHIEANNSESTVQSSDAIAGEKALATCCATAAMPKPTPREDGEITVYSESSGKLNNSSQVGDEIDVPGTNDKAYLMKKTINAIVTYTHRLWREKEYHTGDGKREHQAETGSKCPSNNPGCENVSVEYRFAAPSVTFSATSIKQNLGAASALPAATIAPNTVNSKYSASSVYEKLNPTNPLLNANTNATAEEIGKVYTYCQAINYLSKTYALWGEYWTVDGVIYENDPYLRVAYAPVSKNTVGKSTEACVKVVRPYNFRISSIDVSANTNSASGKPATAGTTINATFDVNVTTNNNDYYVTDIPNAKVQIIGFTLDGVPSDVKGGTAGANSSPCGFFQDKLGVPSSNCSVLDNKTKNIHSGTANTGKEYYTTDHYVHRESYLAEVPLLSTSDKYCVAIGIAPTDSGSNGWGFPSSFNNDWTISNAYCVNVGKNPTMQVWGGSVFADGYINTSATTTYTNNSGTAKAVFGSWDDFMIVANKEHSGDKAMNMASGAALISGLSTSADFASSISKITVSNTDTTKLGNAHIVNPSLLAKVERFRNLYLDDASKYYKTRIIDKGAIQSPEARKLSPVIYYSSDSISVEFDINTSSATLKNAAIPQYVIFAEGDVNISGNVSEIDAWIITPGRVNTCADASGHSLRADGDTCDNTLIIRGPVFASGMTLDRTTGADPHENTSAHPAEYVDLSPSAYIFGYNEAGRNAQPLTTYLRRMPPRY